MDNHEPYVVGKELQYLPKKFNWKHFYEESVYAYGTELKF